MYDVIQQPHKYLYGLVKLVQVINMKNFLLFIIHLL